MLMKMVKSNKDKISTTLIAQKLKSSGSMLEETAPVETNKPIYLFWCVKESQYGQFKLFILFIDLSEFYMLQRYFTNSSSPSFGF